MTDRKRDPHDYLDSAVGHVLCFCRPSDIAEFDRHAALATHIDESAVSGVAGLFATRARKVSGKKSGDTIKELMVSGILPRFKLEIMSARFEAILDPDLK